MATSSAWPCISFPSYLGNLHEYPLLRLRRGRWGWILSHLHRRSQNEHGGLSNKSMWGLISLRRVSLLVKIHSRTSLMAASVLVSAAINDFLNILYTLWNVAVWLLGVRGVLTPDDNAGKLKLLEYEGIRGARRGWGNWRLSRGAIGARGL